MNDVESAILQELRITEPNPELGADGSWHVWAGDHLLGYGATERDAWMRTVAGLLEIVREEPHTAPVAAERSVIGEPVDELERSMRAIEEWVRSNVPESHSVQVTYVSDGSHRIEFRAAGTTYTADLPPETFDGTAEEAVAIAARRLA